MNRNNIAKGKVEENSVQLIRKKPKCYGINFISCLKKRCKYKIECEEIYKDNKTEELRCNFCNKAYNFTHEDIGNMIKDLS